MPSDALYGTVEDDGETGAGVAGSLGPRRAVVCGLALAFVVVGVAALSRGAAGGAAASAADFPTLGAGGVVPRAGPALRGSRPPPGLAAALAKATGPTPGRRGRTGIAVASQRRRAPAQPSPALAAAAQDFSAPPPDQRGKK